MNTQVRQHEEDAANATTHMAAATSGVCLKDRFHIWSDALISAFDLPSAWPYAVTDMVSGNEGVFALVRDGELLCRDAVIASL